MVEDILNILIIIVSCIILYLNFSKSKKVKNSTTYQNQNQYAPTQRPKGRFCPYCGRAIENPAFEFCAGCGNKL